MYVAHVPNDDTENAQTSATSEQMAENAQNCADGKSKSFSCTGTVDQFALRKLNILIPYHLPFKKWQPRSGDKYIVRLMVIDNPTKNWRK